MTSETILIYFAKLIEEELGIIYQEHNYSQLQYRLEEIAKTLKLQGPQELYEESKKSFSGILRELLLDVATNNETSFFRDGHIFNALENTILPTICEKKSSTENLRIWSAASSSGQEVFSIAMSILEWQKKTKSNLKFSILGTDISQRILDRAKAGEYSVFEVERGLPNALLLKYFKRNDDCRWTASSELTDHIEFKKFNLKSPFPFTEKFDAIFCRNVLIYQSVEGKKLIIKKITDALLPGGYLILGSGESLNGISEEYQQVIKDGAVYYCKLPSSY